MLKCPLSVILSFHQPLSAMYHRFKTQCIAVLRQWSMSTGWYPKHPALWPCEPCKFHFFTCDCREIALGLEPWTRQEVEIIWCHHMSHPDPSSLQRLQFSRKKKTWDEPPSQQVQNPGSCPSAPASKPGNTLVASPARRTLAALALHGRTCFHLQPTRYHELGLHGGWGAGRRDTKTSNILTARP